MGRGGRKQEITWRPISPEVELVVPPPVPVKRAMPDWYKDVPKFHDHRSGKSDPHELTPTFKACAPFLDPFMTGYVQQTWCDIFIEARGDEFKWRYAGGPQIMNNRMSPKYLPAVDGYSAIEFVWRQVWIPQLPSGYSMLYTHPFNRHELPFLSLTGIVDNDTYHMEDVANHPFFIREGFSGYIPQGTPMFQMVPIKREAWNAGLASYDERLSVQHKRIRNFFVGGYKSLYWQRKSYE